MITPLLFDVALIGEWTSIFGARPSLMEYASVSIAPYYEVIFSPLERGMRFLFHQWISFNWFQFCLSATAIGFVVVLSKCPTKSKSNRI